MSVVRRLGSNVEYPSIPTIPGKIARPNRMRYCVAEEQFPSGDGGLIIYTKYTTITPLQQEIYDRVQMCKEPEIIDNLVAIYNQELEHIRKTHQVFRDFAREYRKLSHLGQYEKMIIDTFCESAYARGCTPNHFLAKIKNLYSVREKVLVCAKLSSEEFENQMQLLYKIQERFKPTLQKIENDFGQNML